MDTRQKLALGHTPYAGGVPAMLTDTVGAAVDASLAESGLPYERAARRGPCCTYVPACMPRSSARSRLLAEVLEAAWRCVPAGTVVRQGSGRADQRCPSPGGPARTRRVRLVHGVRRLPDLLRYLRAAQVRLQKAPHDLARDAVKAAEVAQVQAAVDAARAAHPGQESRA